jgi:hypothetical protein
LRRGSRKIPTCTLVFSDKIPTLMTTAIFPQRRDGKFVIIGVEFIFDADHVYCHPKRRKPFFNSVDEVFRHGKKKISSDFAPPNSFFYSVDTFHCWSSSSSSISCILLIVTIILVHLFLHAEK